MSGPVEIVLILVAVGYILVRRVMGEPAQAKRMLILPAVLTVIGLSDLSDQVKTPLALVFLVATAAASVLLGALRGASVRISQRDGLAFVRYTGLTIGLWVLNLAVKFGANLILGATDAKDAGAAGNSVMLTLGLGILAEGLVVLYRALRGDHRVMWTQGKDGAPHQMSSFLDDLQRTLNGRGNDPHDDHRPSDYQQNGYQDSDYQQNGYQDSGYQQDGYQGRGYQQGGYQGSGYRAPEWTTRPRRARGRRR